MRPCPDDAVSSFVDAVLRDLSVRGGTYVGRREPDGDGETCVIQTGEDGRYRIALPQLRSSRSVEAFVSEAGAHVAQVLGAPVPRCPRHDHALAGHAVAGGLVWRCPEGEWECALGDYEERTWPQLDAYEQLAPVLAARLRRRGLTFRSLGVSRGEHGLVAEVGLPELRPEVMEAIREAATPLPVTFHPDLDVPIRVPRPPGSSRAAPPRRPTRRTG